MVLAFPKDMILFRFPQGPEAAPKMKPALPLLLLCIAVSARAADRDVVKVNGTPIRQSEVMDRLWQRYGPDTLDEMISELVLRQAVVARGITIAPAEVDARVARLRAGFPDPGLFEQQLRQAGSSVEQLRKEIGDELSREKFVTAEKKLTVTDAELRAAYAAHKDELGVPEAVHLRHLLVSTKDEADAVVAQIKAGADFKQLAREKSLAPTGKLNGGDYGFVAKGMLPPEIEAVAFSMKEGELRELPEGKGVHVLQALERRKAVPSSFEKSKAELRELVLREKVREALPAVVKQLREKADIQPQGA